MSFPREHDIHRRRFGRNVGVGVLLIAFVVLVFGLTVVKVTRGDPMQGFDHTPQTAPAQTVQYGGSAP